MTFGTMGVMRGGLDRRTVSALAKAIAASGTARHVEALIDLIGALVRHDRITVVRYSASQRPEFVSYRNYSAAMVRRYLDVYFQHDPFYRHWRERRAPGIVPLSSFGRKSLKHRRYIAEFLADSQIRDEVGVLLDDGDGWCLGIFLDRAKERFRRSDIELLRFHFQVFAALHAANSQSRVPRLARNRLKVRSGQLASDGGPEKVPHGLWPSLSVRERQVVQLMLAGYPTAGIATRLGLSPGTVKNHRSRIYDRLDITTERELFLQYFDHLSKIQ